MKKIFIILFISVLCSAAVSAQAQENYYFPTQKGAELTYKYYNNRNKPLKDQWDDVRWMRFVVEEVWPQESGMTINVAIENETIARFSKNESFKQVAENLSYGDVKIDGDRVTLDNMQWLVDLIPTMFRYMFSGTSSNVANIKYKIDLSAQTSFPRMMEVGEILPDEKILDAQYSEVLTEEQKEERNALMKMFQTEIGARVSTNNNLAGVSFTDVSAKTQNRKVEAFEKVTTPAGTFDCYKITYEMVTPPRFNPYMMVAGAPAPQPTIEKYADWMSPEVGLVRREKYNDRGKIQEYMQLESYKK